MARKPPAYRIKDNHGSAIAVVTLTDSATGKRKDRYLGRSNTPESREKYHRIIAEWEANGRRLPATDGGQAITVNAMIMAYWRWASEYYTTKEAEHIRQALRRLRKLYGSEPATAIGPNAMRLVRTEMIADGWSRPYINKQMIRIAAAFRWSASRELIPATVYGGIKTLEPLRRGRTPAPEPEPVKPVADDHVAAIEPYVSRQVWAMVRLQRLTGARGGELFKLRPCDIDQSSDAWSANLIEHKTAHAGKMRTLYFNRQAQEVLRPFIADRSQGDYLFKPTDAEADRRRKLRAKRRTPLYGKAKRSGGQGTSSRAGQHYTADSYRVAIRRACKRAGVPAWHPHQLRHTVATEIRKLAGLEAAQLLLGHSSASVTDAVYAERDTDKILSIVELIGA